jgi:peroxiredoxin Q/BCP
MKTKLLIAAVLLSLFQGAFAAPGVGDPAPDFQLSASDGKTYSLSEFRGNSGVVVAFFPKAFTGG